MTVEFKIGKKKKEFAIKNKDALKNIAIMVQGQIIRTKNLDDIDDKKCAISMKLNGEKISLENFLSKVDDIASTLKDPKKKEKSKKKDKSSDKKKKKNKESEYVAKKTKSKDKKKKGKNKKKEISLSFNKESKKNDPKPDDGRIHISKRKSFINE